MYQKYIFFLVCSFLFVRPKRNEPKKKGAGNDNFNLFWQNALSITRPKKVEVRAISGFATAPSCSKLLLIIEEKC
jgi:hypothetical protein